MQKYLSILVSVLFAGLLTVMVMQGAKTLPQTNNLSSEPPFLLVDQQGGATNAVAADDAFAYIGIGPRLAKINITVNPPKLVWQSEILPGFIRDIILTGNNVYFSVIGEGVYRTSKTSYNGSRVINTANPQKLSIAFGHLWVAAGGSGFFANRIDFASPDVSGHYDPGGFIYDISVNKYSADIFGNKTWSGFLAVGDDGFSFFNLLAQGVLDSCDPKPAGDKATIVSWDPIAPTGVYVGTPSGLRIFTGEGSCNPTYVSSYTNGPAYDVIRSGSHAYIVGDGSYVFNGYGSIHKVNVADPSNPYHVASIDFPGEATAVDFNNGRVFVAGGGNGMANSGGGLRIFESAPLTSAGLFATSGSPQNLAFSGSELVSVHGSLGLGIWDITSPMAPVLTGTFDTDGDALRLATAGGLAFVSDDGPGLQIISVTNPTAPMFAGSYAPGRLYRPIAISGTLAVIDSDGGGLETIDVSDPSTPMPIGQLNFGINLWNLEILDQYVLGASGDVYVVDISNPSLPVLTATWSTPGSAFDITLESGLAYVGDGDALRIYNTSNITAPTEIGALSIPSFIYNLFYYNQHIFLSTSSDGIMVIDVRNPANPTFVASLHTLGGGSEILIRDHIAYVADNGGGLLTYKLAPWLAPKSRVFLPMIARD